MQFMAGSYAKSFKIVYLSQYLFIKYPKNVYILHTRHRNYSMYFWFVFWEHKILCSLSLSLSLSLSFLISNLINKSYSGCIIQCIAPVTLRRTCCTLLHSRLTAIYVASHLYRPSLFSWISDSFKYDLDEFDEYSISALKHFKYLYCLIDFKL